MPLRVALINVGFEPWEPDVLPPLLKSPPFGIMYVGAYLRSNSYEVALFDWSGEELGEEKKSALQEFRPDIVGVTVLISSSILRAMEISKWSKEMGAAVVWGGPGPTVLAEITLRDAPVDAVVIGEGELTMLELCTALHDRSRLNHVKGIAFMENGKVVFTSPRPRIEDLDALPMPLWDSIGDIGRYAIPFYGRKAIPMNTSRGCPNTCTFCYSKKMWGYTWHARSAEKILAELRLIRKIYPPLNGVLFDDDLMAGDMKRLRRLCELLIETKTDILWNCQLRADEINEDLAGFIKEAGCRQVSVGVESGSQRLLDMTLKHVRLEDIKAAFDILHGVGIEGVAMLMVGLPGETEEDFAQTKRFLDRLEADSYMFAVYVPYPGTELYKVAREHGFEEPKTLKEWAMRGGEHHTMISRRNLSEVPWQRIDEFMTRMAKKARRMRYWREFKKSPLTAPMRGAKLLSRSRKPNL
ncbi:MAG: radical SAM protein [Methanomassiliicoccales archaeon]|jgi:radical SAM superfamily enzyme YgiQ (UPF0313 family)